MLPELKAYVKENNPPGSIVKQFDPTDPDPDPNAGPFTFTLMPGKNSELFALDSVTGVLKTSVSLDREQTPVLEISVRIEDAGSPKQSADFDISVEVGDENDNPSQSRSVDVVIKNYDGTFPGGEIMFVRPADAGMKFIHSFIHSFIHCVCESFFFFLSFFLSIFTLAYYSSYITH